MSLIFPQVSVLGAGIMGAGIASVCAEAGCRVTLYDVSADTLRQAQKTIEKDLRKRADNNKLTKQKADETLSRLRTTRTLEDCEGSDLVIEAVFERLDVKQEVFSQLDGLLPPTSVFATNTGTLSVTAIAAKTRHPERFCGLHFFNPVVPCKLVEVVATQFTDRDVIRSCEDFITALGKESVTVSDAPGFLVNRLSRAFFGEALRCLVEGLADVATIDKIFRDGIKVARGPFETMDILGIDTDFAVTKAIWEATYHDPRYRPHPLQKKMIESACLGKKVGRGFYEYFDV